MIDRRLWLPAAACGLAALAFAASAPAQDFPPKKAVTLVVGFGQNVVVDTSHRARRRRRSSIAGTRRW